MRLPALLLALPLLAAPLLAQATKPAKATTPATPAATADTALPSASDVLARYARAIGGAEAVTRHASIRSTGTFEMPAAGVKGALLLVQDRERMVMRMELPGMGEMLSGFDGRAGWALNPMQGARVLEGKELEQTRESAGYAAILRQAPAVRQAETVERTTLDGRDCWKLRLTSASGRESHECYDVETGLLVGQWAKQESAMGAIEVTTVMREWKEFGGLRTATELRVQAAGQEQVLRIANMEFGHADDAKVLEVPAAVKALLPAAAPR